MIYKIIKYISISFVLFFFKNLGDELEMIKNKNLSKLLRILLLSPIERDCFELRRILKGLNSDINILAEIFFTRSNKHIQTIKDSYQKCKISLKNIFLNNQIIFFLSI
jgi:hypothetical protein